MSCDSYQDWDMYTLHSKHVLKKKIQFFLVISYWYVELWMMVINSIKIQSVHLMDDGNGHHNICIDGDVHRF